MGSKVKRSLSILGVAALVSLGSFAAHAAMGDSAPAKPEVVAGDPSHPECYDAAKMNDPNDFCYQTIGPWNSMLLSDDEVRSTVSMEQMIGAGYASEEIRRFYPAYESDAK
ncbi:hypothetical protein GU243_12000 [Pseudarthrobacter psychrotolerans]|uniref:Uncharacterized protein n=1 Tax=Pseudarthrobacter psychrotolerans TaxID=2697569 RepID=A0A6P1NJ20_9MICC|nr:hypothetical protein [Pseudarthrobacter psychrotolerans]QHK20336.1 hypothetical protein GU243_12000 [Pseudarthrobacter psychrotolerans]